MEIADSIESAISTGQLRAGTRLPTVRDLARTLEVSLNTVSGAYRRLLSRGLILTDGRRGTTISPRSRVALDEGTPELEPLPGLDLAGGEPDPDLLPDLRGPLAEIELGGGLYAEPHRLESLLAMARHRFGEDGVPADHLAIVSGAMDGLERALQARLLPGDRIVVEDPGYHRLLDLVATLGMVPVPAPVDDLGLLPERLHAALLQGARAVIVTPRAQNPLGAAMDPVRSGELRRVLAGHSDAMVIEDDHAGAVAGAPACTLVDASRPAWAVVRSVSKALGPNLRLAVMAGDSLTVARVEGRQRIGPGWVSPILQAVVANLWGGWDATDEWSRVAAVYARRRHWLLDALGARGVKAHGRSGMNVWIPVAEESPLVSRLQARGYLVTAGERFRIRSGPAIRVTISRLTHDQAEAVAEEIATALRACSSRQAT